MPCGVFEDLFVESRRLGPLFIVSSKCSVVSVISGVFIEKSEGSFLRNVVSHPLVSNLKSASMARCFILAWQTMSKLNSDKRSRHRASQLELSDGFKIYLRES